MMVKLYHNTQLHSQDSNSKPMVKLEKTPTISLTCLVVVFYLLLAYLMSWSNLMSQETTNSVQNEKSNIAC